MKPEYSGRAIQREMEEQIYRHIVDEVTRLDERGIERASRRYAPAQLSLKTEHWNLNGSSYLKLMC